ncbi:MAG: Ger(x)C family spore germination protein [Bacilli bacterium]|nr:Ger(x)C family spore germination protein [Bacilli bacterium]MDD3304887.1 Ger(x)C family spore germination protein [Bacilli bacterium]MDD4053513.1 Ger(x)C family spore germination protein [Bacilli bacterium]MDD4411548.1 Ger(x)C family spore germination protein [Bacilli bacterium]
MNKKYFVLLIALILCTTGCWNYKELNEIAIIGAIGIDYDDEKELFDISVQILNAKKTSSGSSSGSEQQSPVTVYQSKAKTIHEALRNIVLESPKKLYLGHLEILVFGEGFAKKHLEDGVDFFLRDLESRKVFNIVLAKEDKASNIIKILTPLEGMPAHSILQSILSASKNKGIATDITYDEFLSQIYANGTEAVIPTIIIDGKVSDGTDSKDTSTTAPKTKLRIGTLGIFEDFKLKGYLDQDESIGYNLLQNNLDYSIFSFPCDDKKNYAAVEMNSAKSKVSLSIKDDKPKADIKISIEANLTEYNCKSNLSDEKVIEEISKKAAKNIKGKIDKVIKASQEKYNIDFIGFGEQVYLNNYSYWKKHKNEWKNIFPNIEYKINLDLKLPKKGSIINSAKEG